MSHRLLPNPALEIKFLLSFILPPELVVPILNYAELFHRSSVHRRLETVLSGRGQSLNEREKRRKVYLEWTCERPTRKVVWMVRMPELGKQPALGRVAVGRVVDVLEVSLYRPTSSVRRNTSANHPSLPIPNPAHQSIPPRISILIADTKDPEILRVPLSLTVPNHPRTQHIVTWSRNHPLLEAAQVGDTIRLIIPAVYGREAKPGSQGGGFQRLEVWQVAAHVFTDW
ncbi:hypothetical protein JAAARDRAFT_82039 [Jaapia argillacea MUCL 33604]|uniref:Uncharacterized protein n=1 Tax=Jaapia argillacea MUCL 33604 TaxID=933084 RepID=A0A067PHS4_9AGAM|nr:hypothetical protein JAAARDRAFT_82039 [Jaapia argillacea MUCL 33604]